MALTVDRNNALSGTVVILFGVAVLLASLAMPEGPSDNPSPGVYPAFIAACMIALGAVLIVQSVVLDTTTIERPDLSLEAVKSMMPPFVMLIVYVLLLPTIGFLVGTIAFVLILTRYSDVTDYRVSIPLSVGIAVVLQYVFGTILRVPLPDGVFPIARLLPALNMGAMVA